jgi:uncharacterized membrane protein YjjP (DUF1212 family)
LETVYDWVSIAIFAGLVVLFMQRSTQRVQRDSLWQYLVAAVGCALANWLGNTGLGEGSMLLQIGGIVVIGATLGFIWIVLRPLDRPTE